MVTFTTPDDAKDANKVLAVSSVCKSWFGHDQVFNRLAGEVV